MKRFFQLQQFGVMISAGMILGGSVLATVEPAIAQRTIRLRLPDISAPGNRESGSTRSSTCIATDENLVALMPQSNYGLTQNAYPTWYFYLPATTAEHLKFVLLNANTNDLVYEGQFQVGNSGGIASVSLPNTSVQQSLEVGESYVWYVSVICDPLDPSANVVTEGQISRVDPIAGASDAAVETLPALYAEAGLWYDALAASAALKQTGDSTAAWDALLEAVDLNSLIPIELLNMAPSVTRSDSPLAPLPQ